MTEIKTLSTDSTIQIPKTFRSDINIHD